MVLAKQRVEEPRTAQCDHLPFTGGVLMSSPGVVAAHRHCPWIVSIVFCRDSIPGNDFDNA